MITDTTITITLQRNGMSKKNFFKLVSLMNGNQDVSFDQLDKILNLSHTRYAVTEMEHNRPDKCRHGGFQIDPNIGKINIIG